MNHVSLMNYTVVNQECTQAPDPTLPPFSTREITPQVESAALLLPSSVL